MKKIRFLSGVILVITAFLFGGCYTQLAMRGNPSDNIGYSDNNQSNENYQTPADSAYGNQYDSLATDQYSNQDYYGSGSINNYYLGYPSYWNSWYGYPTYSLGLYWGNYYNPFYGNPFYWNSYNNWGCYFCYFNPPVLYSAYYNPYYSPYYSPYYNGYYGTYYGHYANRSKGTYRLRNNDGMRGDGGRGTITGGGGAILGSVPSGRNENTSVRNNTSSNSARSSGSYTSRNFDNVAAAVPERVQSAGYRAERNNSGNSRSTYRPQYQNNRQNNSSYNPSRSNRGESRTYNNNRSQRRYEAPRSSSSGRSYSPPKRSYSPPQRSSYSPPQRSYSPPQRSYSPPARSYSAPRSYSPPPARASEGGRGSSNSGGRRR